MKTVRLLKEQFPFLLKQMEKAPDYLDCAGALPPSDEYTFLCVIGSRHHSSYGRDACITLLSGLKNYPIVIVSGLAIGIDSLAHEEALKLGMKVIAFPGSGLSKKVLYPRTHLKLAERIVASGNTLLSSFDKDQRGDKWTFPVRNQLMAGISHAVLIIEGKKGSGTLLTANYALELNRQVLVVPGSIFSELSHGPHSLCKEGATPVTTSKDILEALGFAVELATNTGDKNSSAHPGTHPDTQKQLAFSTLQLSPEQKRIVHELQFTPLSSTDLIEKTLLPATTFNTIMSQLELEGMVLEQDGIYRLRRG